MGSLQTCILHSDGKWVQGRKPEISERRGMQIAYYGEWRMENGESGERLETPFPPIFAIFFHFTDHRHRRRKAFVIRQTRHRRGAVSSSSAAVNQTTNI
eukprot:scaffold19713_cov47-Cyclotella_meneghiniana.AAC.5